MGLDVYLYRYDDFEDTQKREATFNHEREQLNQEVLLGERTGKDFGDLPREVRDRYNAAWEALPDDEKDALSEREGKLREKYGMNDDEEGPGKECLDEIDSKIHPNHMFKIGYMRSSYNDGGINRVLQLRLDTNLYEIFGMEDPNEYYQPNVDWGASLKRAREARDAFAKYLDEKGAWGVLPIGPNVFGGIDRLKEIGNRETALKKFLEERERWAERVEKNPDRDLHDYHSNAGFFSQKGMKIHAAMPGIEDTFHSQLGLPIMPTTYLVYSIEPEDGDEQPFKWYLDALEVVMEFCEWALAHPDKDKFVLHWSG